MVVVALVEGAIVGTCTILVRHVWGKLYSNEEEVISYVAKMIPLLALSDFLDGFQCVLSGTKSSGLVDFSYCSFIILIRSSLLESCVIGIFEFEKLSGHNSQAENISKTV